MAEPNVMATHLQSLIRAKFCVLAIRSKEERRVEALLRGVADSLPDAETQTTFKVRYWSCTEGITEVDENGVLAAVDGEAKEPGDVLKHIGDTEERAIYVLRDFHPYLGSEYGTEAFVIRRHLRDLVRRLKGKQAPVARIIVLLSSVLELPAELESEIHVVEWPLPTQAELTAAITETIAGIKNDEIKAAAEKEDLPRIVRAAVGLTMEQTHGAIRRSLVEKKTIHADLISQEKKQAIGDDGVLEWLEPLPDGLSAIGGLDNLKAFALDRKMAFGLTAREYGLDPQKGIFLCGVPGTGKSYFARALAGEYGFFAVRLVVANLFGSLLGETEGKWRRARKRMRIMAPLLVLVDEVDKAGGCGDRDGGTSERFMGEFLTWLQEPTEPECPVYKLATCNNIETIALYRPELIRDGRWDERFFVDLPTRTERASVIDLHVKKRFRGTPIRNFELIDAKRVAAATNLFSPAELEAVVASAMFRGFRELRPTTTEDLLAEARGKVPLGKTAGPRIKALREWADGRAKFAGIRERDDDESVV